MTAVDGNLPQPVLVWVDAAGNVNNLAFDVVVNEEWDEGAEVTAHPVETGEDVADHVRVALPTCKLTIRSTNEPLDVNNWEQATTSQIPSKLRYPYWVPGSGVINVPEWVNPIELRSLVGLGGGAVGSLAGSTGNLVGAVAGLVAAQLLLPAYGQNTATPTTAGLSPDVPPSPGPQPTIQQWSGKDFVEATHALLVQLKNSAQLLDFIGTKQVEFDMVIDTLTFSRNADTGTGEDVTLGLKKVRIVSTQTVAAPIPNLSGGGGLTPAPKGHQDPVAAPPAKQSTALQLLSGLKSLLGSAP